MKRKLSSDEDGTSSPPLITKRRKAVDHAPRQCISLLAHQITSPSSDRKSGSSPTARSTKLDAGSDSDDSESQDSPVSLSPSSESSAEAFEEEPKSEDDITSTSTSSSSSSSSDSPSSSDSTQILTLPVPQKPSMTRIPPSATMSDLHQRLSAFLPNLAAANHELEVERAAGTLGERSIETVGADDQNYIEMDLGLGVLEEKRLDAEGSGSSGDDESLDGDDHGIEEDNTETGDGGLRDERGETDVLGKLLRRKKSNVNIQVIDAG